ncbi:MAG: DNA repair protein RecN [Lachnospiraceae bacterium]|nr:DNA repair protein RecN [Lachnospiraceae bacterium]
MLTNLHVKNMALIEEADVTFENGLNILSGETGAGKSILIGSINLALGARANKDIIRTGKEYALVELTFDISEPELLNKLRELDVDVSEGQIIISRKIYENKSVTRVNGEACPVSQLKSITELLIDVHGQHEHQSLLKKDKHLTILDDYAHSDLSEVKSLYEEYTSCRRELQGMTLNDEERRRELSFLEFEIGEIEAARLVPDEEEELMESFKKLSNAVNLLNTVASVYESVGYERGGAGSGIERAVKELLGIVEYDKDLEPLRDQILDIEALMSDFCNALTDYRDNLTVDDEALSNVQSRLDLIHELKRKYGRTIEDILAHLEESKARYQALTDYEERRSELELNIKLIEGKLRDASRKLSKKRKLAALDLQKKIIASLSEMNFLDVRFEIAFSDIEPTAKGTDDVEFLISTNPGESLKPLERVASGGELSRIMLAIKTVLAKTYYIDTLIFDEIDAGISGITASCVGRMLRNVGTTSQVICISHLPQIVAKADTHFLIEKNVSDDKTFTHIRKLSEEDSVREVARLLGGDNITQNTLISAKELKMR